MWTSAGVHGESRSDHLEHLLVAVHLELDHPLGIDRILRLGRADEPLEARVVDLAGQAVSRVGGPAALGQVGVEEVVVGISHGIQEAVDRLGLAPAVLLQTVDPGELGQGVDQLGVGLLPGDLLQAQERVVDVLPVGPLEVETA